MFRKNGWCCSLFIVENHISITCLVRNVQIFRRNLFFKMLNCVIMNVRCHPGVTTWVSFVSIYNEKTFTSTMLCSHVFIYNKPSLVSTVTWSEAVFQKRKDKDLLQCLVTLWLVHGTLITSSRWQMEIFLDQGKSPSNSSTVCRVRNKVLVWPTVESYPVSVKNPFNCQ